jgi:hypothetical protein
LIVFLSFFVATKFTNLKNINWYRTVLEQKKFRN